MNEDIKFRAWDRHYRHMVYQSPTVDAAKILARYDVVMQFTGITDKNGKEIFEGDILMINVGWDVCQYTNSPVTFKNGAYYTVIGDNNYRLGGWIHDAIEVIGNIHENLELLQESQKCH